MAICSPIPFQLVLIIEIVIYVGKTRFFACTGVFIRHGGRSKVLTSASLVRDSGDDIHQKINHNLRVVTITTI